MQIQVRYHSRSGNTQTVAESIAGALGVAAQTCADPIAEPVDLLFLGGAVYAGGIDKYLKDFIERLDPAKVGCAAVFGTSAIKKEPEREIVRLLRERGIRVSKHSFHCRGAFAVLHRSHPSAADREQAAAFALKVANE